MSQKINQLRNKYSRALSKPVTKDSFIFSVLEEEKNLRRSRKESDKQAPNYFEELEERNPQSCVENLFSWYSENYPELTSEDVLDFIKKHSLVEAVICLRKDLGKNLSHFSLSYPFDDPRDEDVHIEEPKIEGASSLTESSDEEKSGKELVFESELKNQEEPSSSNEDLEKVKPEEEPFLVSDAEVSSEEERTPTEDSLADSESDVSLQEEVKPFFTRSELENLVTQFFPSYSSYFLAYFDWSFSDEFKVDFDFDSLPPSGRALPLIRRNFPSSELAWGKKAKTQNIFPADNTSNHQEEKKARDEALDALRNLKRDKRLGQVQLKPQNSFLRRVQHKVVSGAEGFKSKSVGQEPNRSILICKK